MYKWYQVFVQMILGFSTKLGWGRGWKSCMANSKDWRSENVNAIELNCKVVKKVATAPPFLHQPPLSRFITPFLAKKFVPLQVTKFLEGPTPPPAPLIRGRGSSNYAMGWATQVYHKKIFLEVILGLSFHNIPS